MKFLRIYIQCVFLLLTVVSNAQLQWKNVSIVPDPRIYGNSYRFSENKILLHGTENLNYEALYVLDNDNVKVSFSSAQYNYIRDFYFVDNDLGWLLTSNGKVYKTIDGAATWDIIGMCAAVNSGRDILFVDSLVGFVTGDKIFYRTLDGGKNWALDTVGMNLNSSVRIQKDNQGGLYLDRDDNHFSYSLDSGKVWADMSVITQNNERCKLKVFNDSVFCLYGKSQGSSKPDSSLLYLTYDRGKKWVKYKFPNNSQVLQAYNIGADSLYFATSEKLFYSYNRGLKWTEVGITTILGSGESIISLFYEKNIFTLTTYLGNVLTSKDFHQWKSIVKSIDFPYLKIHLIDNHRGVAIANDSNLYATNNGGVSWINYLNDIDPVLMSFPNDTLGFVVSNNSMIYATKDGGVTWNNHPMVMDQKPQGVKGRFEVSFSNDKIGWMSFYHDFYKTTDAGATWKKTDVNSSFVHGYFGVAFGSESNGCVVKEESSWWETIYCTSNGGLTWNSKMNLTAAKVYFLDSLNAWAIGVYNNDYPQIQHSNNGGKTWSVQYTGNTGGQFFDICFLNKNVGYAVGKDGVIFETINGGIDWKSYASSTFFNLRRIYIKNDSIGWITGDGNTVLSLSDMKSEGNYSCDPFDVGFTYENTNYTVIVHDASQGKPGIIWDFGDGTITNGKDTVHVYNKEGNYNICQLGKSFCETKSLCYSLAVSNAIEEQNSFESITVFNTANDVLIKLNQENDMKTRRLIFTNAIGQQMQEIVVSGNSTVEISKNNLQEGVYVIAFYNEQNELEARKKIILLN